MKSLKKHPKQQRMEEMTFPITKPKKKLSKSKIQKYTMYPCPHGNTGFDICVECRDEAMAKWIKTNHPIVFRFGKCFYHPKEPAVIQSGTPAYNLCQKCLDKNRSRVTMTGCEYLRSINDDDGFTLLPRIVWRVLAVGVLGVAIIISFYIYGKR